MNFERRSFKTTKGLLRDVMRKQAGSIEKAILEGVMNSVDAGASEIRIEISEDSLVIEDNGKGMVKDEIYEYFEKFGLKDEDIEDKEFGKFRMGRGQIFNFGINRWYTNDYILVVNLEEPETEVEVNGEKHTVDTSDLGFSVGEGIEDNKEGCRIEVDLFNRIDDIKTKVKDIEEQIQYISWFHDIEITVNNKLMNDEFDFDYSTDYAYFSFNRGGYISTSLIYNKGAKVKKENLGPVKANVISREDLDLNFARNDVLSGCPVFERVKEDYNEVTRKYLLENVSYDDYNSEEIEWLVKEALNDEPFYRKVKDVEFIEDIDGMFHSLESLEGSKLVFASEGDKTGQEVIRRTDAIVLPVSIRRIFRESGVFTTKNISDILDEEFKYEMQKYDEDGITKRRKKNLAMLKWAAEQLGNFKLTTGNSTHRDVWMEDSRTIVVDKDYINKSQQNIAVDVLISVIKEASHKKDTRDNPEEDYSYDRRLKSNLDKLPELQNAMLNKNREVQDYIENQLA